ncbi:hypothetical protein WJX84_009239 [Apatococcus fuscideae]|uniref:Septin-type G domain-containing protein n=1 Tax=Apatococcus fuscideae TaxID=2026836 RepID=A0AAW1SXU5_9CHLO
MNFVTDLAGLQKDAQFGTLEHEIKRTASELGVRGDQVELVPPFPVVASNQYRETTDGLMPFRPYAWGACEINNPLHSDFRLVKQVLTCAAFPHYASRRHTSFMSTAPNENTSKQKP